jgi:hypothetical protein
MRLKYLGIVLQQSISDCLILGPRGRDFLLQCCDWPHRGESKTTCYVLVVRAFLLSIAF